MGNECFVAVSKVWGWIWMRVWKPIRIVPDGVPTTPIHRNPQNKGWLEPVTTPLHIQPIHTLAWACPCIAVEEQIINGLDSHV